MSSTPAQKFKDREEWRNWLEENGASEKEVWVIIYKKHSGRRGLQYQEAVEEAICFGWIDSKMQSIDNNKFRQRFSPRKKTSIWSKINKQTAEKMIQRGKMTTLGFEAINKAKANGKWSEAYSSKTPPPIPKDLEKSLKENEPAWTNFKEFPNSMKLRYIYWVNTAKKEETRQRRINAVIKKTNQKSAL